VIIVSGPIHVAAVDRGRYLAACREVILAARASHGCIDFHLSADPIDSGRINVYEEWESVEAVEAFRGSGPPTEQTVAIRTSRVSQHEVTSSTAL